MNKKNTSSEYDNTTKKTEETPTEATNITDIFHKDSNANAIETFFTVI